MIMDKLISVRSVRLPRKLIAHQEMYNYAATMQLVNVSPEDVSHILVWLAHYRVILVTHTSPDTWDML